MNLELIESVINLIDLGAIKNEDISKNLKSAIEQTKKSVHKNDIEKIYFDFVNLAELCETLQEQCINLMGGILTK